MNRLDFDRHHAGLKRLLALLYVYLGIVDTTNDSTGIADGPARALAAMAEPATISRRLHRMILHLLWPVEAATRRLIVALAATLPVADPAIASPAPSAPDAPQAARPVVETIELDEAEPDGAEPIDPASRKPPRFALLDPPQRLVWQEADGPLQLVEFHIKPADPAKAFDQLADAHLMRRVTALAFALQDLNSQAERLVRLRQRSVRHAAPLRRARLPGMPPAGWPKSRWQDEHHILAATHDIAIDAIRNPDTS